MEASNGDSFYNSNSLAQTPTMNTNSKIFLDGSSLTISQLEQLADYNCNVQIDLTEESWKGVHEGRQVVEKILDGEKRVYGINTGFGHFANVAISR